MLLLDADVIIDLHRFGVWDQIVEKNQVFVSSIILHQEVYFYLDDGGTRHEIDLKTGLGKKFHEISAEASVLHGFSARFDAVFSEEIHNGEKEALCLMKSRGDLAFCTCDKMAIKALSILDLAERGISFEHLLRQSGITKKNLEPKHTESWFQRFLKEGSIMKIQGVGSSKPWII
ncbi:MAG: hypothetical protein NT009_09685 [Proteobacteria bacterium]|nr:hypothetical protein [Pseudomonadota bacterium]